MGMMDDILGLTGVNQTGLASAIGDYLRSVVSGEVAAQGPLGQNYYDPQRSFAQNALDPRALSAATDIAMGLGTGPLGAVANRMEALRMENAGLTANPMESGSFFQRLAAKPDPIRAYHGSPEDFARFDSEFIGKTTDEGALGRALYFSTDPQVAAGGPHRYEVSLGISNPLQLEMKEWPIPGRSLAAKQELARQALDLPATATAEEITAAARAQGHDAISLDYSPLGYKHQELAVYDPALIEILRKYGIAGPAAIPGALMPFMGDQQQF